MRWQETQAVLDRIVTAPDDEMSSGEIKGLLKNCAKALEEGTAWLDSSSGMPKGHDPPNFGMHSNS